MRLEHVVLAGRRVSEIWPGLVLAVAVAALALAAEEFEHLLFGVRYVDGLVLAIIAGTLLHTGLGLAPRLACGVQFAARTLLEIAIVLLGGTISAGALAASGVGMIVAVGLVVMLTLACSYCIARALGLDGRLATLIACGNSICGNSAIMAAAPVIEAPAEDVAASIVRPVKELKGFRKIALKPGESRTVHFTIDEGLLKFYNAKLQYVAEPGDFNVQIGLDSQNVGQATFTLK